MKPTKKRNRPKPYDEMSTTGALSRVTDATRPKPYDEMSTTGAMTRLSDVPRSYRPIARPEGLRERAEERRLRELEERSLRSQERESEDFKDFGGAKKFAEGGMVRGCKPGQSSGKKFTGTF